MISVDLARSLRIAGLRWEPHNGDWFVVDTAELVDSPLVLSDMTVDVKSNDLGTFLAFNGTTEWALDSVGLDETLWLPAESQLRELLGEAFHRLERAGSGWRVELRIDCAPITFSDEACVQALGRAALHVLTR